MPNAPWFSSETLALYKSLTYLLTYLHVYKGGPCALFGTVGRWEIMWSSETRSMAALAQWTNVGMIDNSVNEMEVHIQQTNDRLQCIRQVANGRIISVQAVVRGTTNPAPCCHLANDTDLLTPVLWAMAGDNKQIDLWPADPYTRIDPKFNQVVPWSLHTFRENFMQIGPAVFS